MQIRPAAPLDAPACVALRGRTRENAVSAERLAALDRVVQELRRAGHARLFLGCSRDPAARSFGFYRHLGWRPTGQTDALGDEVLELV